MGAKGKSQLPGQGPGGPQQLWPLLVPLVESAKPLGAHANSPQQTKRQFTQGLESTNSKREQCHLLAMGATSLDGFLPILSKAFLPIGQIPSSGETEH